MRPDSVPLIQDAEIPLSAAELEVIFISTERGKRRTLFH